MKIAVLHSPTAGDQELSRAKLISLVKEAGYQPKYFPLRGPAWKKREALRGVEFVVVAGGDGSIREAVLHLHDQGRPLAFLPLGTANNICTSLGIGGTPEAIIASWSKSSRAKLDLGVAKGPWGEKLFVESAGVGLIGRTISIMDAVTAATEHSPKSRVDRVHRDSSVVLALAHELQPVGVALSLEGRPAQSEHYLLLEVMNISHVGPNLELAPKAKASDGFFDVIAVTAKEREKLKRIIAHALGGQGPSAALVARKVRGLTLQISGGEFRLDDAVIVEREEAVSRSPRRKVRVEISIRPQAFEVLLPAAKKTGERGRCASDCGEVIGGWKSSSCRVCRSFETTELRENLELLWLSTCPCCPVRSRAFVVRC